MKYVYCFSVWPDETGNFNKSIFDLFEMLNTRIEMIFTESDFEMFRSKISHHGFLFREIERIPYSEPEIIL